MHKASKKRSTKSKEKAAEKAVKAYFSKKRTLEDLYELKRTLIENNLFGIDKDYGAIETCKLRLWLSLTIDEDNVVKPLPNLDFRSWLAHT